MASWNPLLGAPAFPEDGYARLADRLARLLGTRGDVLLLQGEAAVALEAVAAGLARPSLQALNIVTSRYGRWFGEWLRRSGAIATDLAAEPGRPVALDAVERALAGQPSIEMIALAHAESGSGILNPLPEIARLARDRGMLLVVDAVASAGGHPLDVEALGIGISVIGPQKALGGSSGLSAVTVSPEAWALLQAPGAAPSALSLTDLKQQWLETGRGALPGMPSALEFHALEATLDRVEAEGMEALVARHALAGAAARAGLRAVGVPPWADERSASNLVTAVAAPQGLHVSDILRIGSRFGAGISAGVGEMADRLLRLNHTGPQARFEPVLGAVIAFGSALQALGHRVELGAAAEAVSEAYSAAPASAAPAAM